VCGSSSECYLFIAWALPNCSEGTSIRHWHFCVHSSCLDKTSIFSTCLLTDVLACSVSQVQDFPGQLLQLDEAAKAGPIIPKRKGGGQTRPSSADKARPTTAGPKRDSKSRPSSAGRREASALRPAVWLEPVQARQIHEAEQSLRDVFNRPSSAGRKANHRTKSPDRSKNRPNNRPSSAERTREGDSVKNSVWLTDKSKPNVMKINCDTNQNNVVAPRPGSAGRKRSGNGLAPLRGPAVDQNGVKRPHTP